MLLLLPLFNSLQIHTAPPSLNFLPLPSHLPLPPFLLSISPICTTHMCMRTEGGKLTTDHTLKEK